MAIGVDEGRGEMKRIPTVVNGIEKHEWFSDVVMMKVQIEIRNVVRNKYVNVNERTGSGDPKENHPRDDCVQVEEGTQDQW